MRHLSGPTLGLMLLTTLACQPDPTVSILSPADNALVTAPALEVVVAASDTFILDEAAVGGANERGHGHIGLFLDEAKVATVTRSSVILNLDVLGIGDGFHTLEAQLLNNDRTPVDPPVTDRVEITVSLGESPTPTATPGTPTPAADTDTPPAGSPTPGAGTSPAPTPTATAARPDASPADVSPTPAATAPGAEASPPQPTASPTPTQTEAGPQPPTATPAATDSPTGAGDDATPTPDPSPTQGG